MFSNNKNSYLQGNFNDINAGLLNRSLQRAWSGLNIDEHDLSPPFNRLTSEQPHIPVENVDPTRRPEGFGRNAMPKLRRDLHNHDVKIVVAALTSISDLVHDPERCYEAIRMKVVDRFGVLLLHVTRYHMASKCRFRKKMEYHRFSTGPFKYKPGVYQLRPLLRGRPPLFASVPVDLLGKRTIELVDLVCHEIVEIRERAAYTLKVLAGASLGKEAIVRNEWLLNNLLDKVEDEYSEVRIHIAGCLEMVARFWNAADALVEAGFIQVLLSNLSDITEIVEIHLTTLKSLLYCDGKKIAIEEDGFETLVKLLDRDEGAILAKTCEALVRLCDIKEGRKLAKQFSLLTELNRLLHDERVEVHAAAAKAIMFCTIKSSEKITASKFTNMPKRLVQLCKNKLNHRAQMYAIQALTCMCEHPAVRKEVREKYYNDVKSIQLSNDVPEIRKFKNNLLSMLQWLPYTKE